MVVLIKKGVAHSLFLLFFIILLSGIVWGLGVSPSRVTLRFVPGYVYEGEACFGIESIGLLRIEPSGEFADNIELLNVDESGEFYVPDGGCVKYKLKMPDFIERPGRHRTSIFATEIPDQTYGTIFALVRIDHQIDILVPYPGKYLEITIFSAKNADAGKTVPFTADIINKGNETVTEARGAIIVYDKDNKELERINTNIVRDIEPEQTRVLSANWNSGANKEGNYHAFLDLVYDEGAKNNATTKFKLGGLDVNLLDYSKEIIIGGIKEFYATVDSIWSETVKGVRANVSVYNYSNNSESITSFETLTRDIPPWGTETLKGYLDTSNLNLGTYDVKIILYYENLNKEYNGNLSIIKEPPKPEEKKENKFWQTLRGIFTTKVLLIILALALLIILAILIYVLIPKKKKQEESKEVKDIKGEKAKK